MATGSGPGGRIIERDIRRLPDRNAEKPPQPARQTTFKVSPLARNSLRIEGSLALKGTGPGGRMSSQCRKCLAKSQLSIIGLGSNAELGSGPKPGEVVSVKGMHETIATRMHQSLMESAQLSMDMEVTMNDAVKMRSGLVEEWAAIGVKPTYTDLVIKACAKANFTSMMNSRFSLKELRFLRSPCWDGCCFTEVLWFLVRNADKLSIKELASETCD